jgi:hypothetical protein
MKTFLGLLAVIVIGLFVIAIASPEGRLKAEATTAIQAGLLDPGSATFDGVRVVDGHYVCGWVNAKNRFGGYVGSKRFVYQQFTQGCILSNYEAVFACRHLSDVIKTCHPDVFIPQNVLDALNADKYGADFVKRTQEQKPAAAKPGQSMPGPHIAVVPSAAQATPLPRPRP